MGESDGLSERWSDAFVISFSLHIAGVLFVGGIGYGRFGQCIARIAWRYKGFGKAAVFGFFNSA